MIILFTNSLYAFISSVPVLGYSLDWILRTFGASFLKSKHIIWKKKKNHKIVSLIRKRKLSKKFYRSKPDPNLNHSPTPEMVFEFGHPHHIEWASWPATAPCSHQFKHPVYFPVSFRSVPFDKLIPNVEMVLRQRRRWRFVFRRWPDQVSVRSGRTAVGGRLSRFPMQPVDRVHVPFTVSCVRKKSKIKTIFYRRRVTVLFIYNTSIACMSVFNARRCNTWNG